jgi:hypothetical protein
MLGVQLVVVQELDVVPCCRQQARAALDEQRPQRVVAAAERLPQPNTSSGLTVMGRRQPVVAQARVRSARRRGAARGRAAPVGVHQLHLQRHLPSAWVAQLRQGS